MFTPAALVVVALGGALGAVGRYAVQATALRMFGPAFPWGTLGVNVVGSLLMGLCAALLLERGGNTRLTLLLMTGILGGFTTFSAFSFEVVRLAETGALARAALYAAMSVILSITALVGGLALGRAL